MTSTSIVDKCEVASKWRFRRTCWFVASPPLAPCEICIDRAIRQFLIPLITSAHRRRLTEGKRVEKQTKTIALNDPVRSGWLNKRTISTGRSEKRSRVSSARFYFGRGRRHAIEFASATHHVMCFTGFNCRHEQVRTGVGHERPSTPATFNSDRCAKMPQTRSAPARPGPDRRPFAGAFFHPLSV